MRVRILASFALLLSMLVGALVLYRMFTRPPPVLAGASAPTVGMSIEPLDPRVVAGGGGSRALYLDVPQDGRPLPQALQESHGVQVWEVLRRGGDAAHSAALTAHFVYHAPVIAPDCVITEWGIAWRALPAPRRGAAVRYVAQRTVPGAPPLSAEVKLPRETGLEPGAESARYIPVARWSDGGAGAVRIAPGKSARVVFLARAADGAGTGDAAGSPPRALELRAYARVTIGRASRLVESSNALYAVWVDESDMLKADGGIEDPVENLRSLAYLPRTAPQQALAAQDPAPAVRATPSGPPQPGYVVQLGAFREEAHARALAARLTRAGFACTVTRIEAADGTRLYRVRLTPALSRHDAELLSTKIGETVPELRPLALRADP